MRPIRAASAVHVPRSPSPRPDPRSLWAGRTRIRRRGQGRGGLALGARRSGDGVALEALVAQLPGGGLLGGGERVRRCRASAKGLGGPPGPGEEGDRQEGESGERQAGAGRTVAFGSACRSSSSGALCRSFPMNYTPEAKKGPRSSKVSSASYRICEYFRVPRPGDIRCQPPGFLSGSGPAPGPVSSHAIGW